MKNTSKMITMAGICAISALICSTMPQSQSRAADTTYTQNQQAISKPLGEVMAKERVVLQEGDPVFINWLTNYYTVPDIPDVDFTPLIEFKSMIQGNAKETKERLEACSNTLQMRNILIDFFDFVGQDDIISPTNQLVVYFDNGTSGRYASIDNIPTGEDDPNIQCLKFPANFTIPENKFKNQTELTKVVMYYTTEVGAGAFVGCTKLTSVLVKNATTDAAKAKLDNAVDNTNIVQGDTP